MGYGGSFLNTVRQCLKKWLWSIERKGLRWWVHFRALYSKEHFSVRHPTSESYLFRFRSRASLFHSGEPGSAQYQFDSDPSQENQQLLNDAKALAVVEIHLQEEAYWRQKAHLKWLQEGDRNTSFFHSIAVQKRAATSIRELTDDSGARVSDPSLISSMVVDYYHSLFSSQGCIPSEELQQALAP